MLPTPIDPNFEIPDPTEEEFLLLGTGAWDDQPDDADAFDDKDVGEDE